MRKAALLLLSLTLLAGCMSVPSKRYFQLMIQDIDGPRLSRIDKTLYIEPARVDPLYDDFRIIYRVSPYELKYYTHGFWAKKPDALFREAMANYFLKRQVFPRVILDVLQADPEIVLRTNIRILEEIDNPDVWFARLAMDWEFLEFKTGQTILRYTFDRKLPLKEKKVGFLPDSLSLILREELERASLELVRIFQEKEKRTLPLNPGR